MIEILDRSNNRPLPCGLVSTLRSLKIGESIVVLPAKKSAVHPAARRAGVRVTLRTLDNGMVCVWRVPSTDRNATASVEPAAAPPTAADTYESEDEGIAEGIRSGRLNIFGEPIKDPSSEVGTETEFEVFK